MKRFWIVFAVNILFIIVLIHIPTSDLYYDTDTPIQHISRDSDSYLNTPDMDMKRTVGYPLLLDTVTKYNNWYLIMVLLNCFLGAWLFHVTYQMIGPLAWLLFFLGAYTVYAPLILSDMLFAALFVTSILKLRQRDLWGHFILLGLASLIRPSLAWFFLIEPFVLYFYGYKGRVLYWSGLIAFAVTALSPIRNLINHGIWTHSDILKYNMESVKYFGGRESIPQYFIKAFKINFIDDHYKYVGAVLNIPRTGMSFQEITTIKGAAYWMTKFINVGIWILFGVRFIRGKINLGDALILAYFVIPTLFGGTGARLRLPIEWILLL